MVGDLARLSVESEICNLSTSINMDPNLKAATEAEVDWADDDDEKKSRHHADGPPEANVEAWNANTPLPPSSTYYDDNDDHKQGGKTKAVSMQWSAQTASHASSALIKYATGSTLLPQQIAEVVSNLSLLARVLLKSAAFFIELVLEAAKYSTGLGLGITRRALISAVGTARALHSIGSGEEWDAQAAGRPLTIAKSVKNANEAFLSLLDKYTAVGIYLIHHTFTMAELFAMSGFYIAGNSLQAGLAAADESVRMIDGIFGSNETSRALASFITMVRGEFAGDPRFADRGRLGVLATLTKAITAFAVLQNSTFKRSAKSMKMRVLYDCTVLGEVETKSWRSMIVGSGNFVKTQGPPEPRLLQSPGPVERSPSAFADRSPTGRYLDLPDLSRVSASDRSNHHRFSTASAPPTTAMPSSRTRQQLGDGLCLTDIGPDYAKQGWHQSGLPSSSTANSTRPGSVSGDDASIMADLDFLVGSEADDADSMPFVVSNDLPEDLRDSLSHFRDDGIEEGVLSDGSQGPKQVRRYIRKCPSPGRNETVYEVTTETIETTETVTTTEERRRSARERPVLALTALESTLTARTPDNDARNGSSLIERDITTSRSGLGTQSVFEGGREMTFEQEDEWCEIARTTNSAPSTRSDDSIDTLTARSPGAHVSDVMDIDDDHESSALPEAPNGGPVALRGKSGHRTDRSLEASTTMQVVLKTMTKKLIQKRRTIRKIELRSDTEDDDVMDTLDQSSSYRRYGHLTPPEGADERHARREAAKASPKGSKTAPTSPTIGRHAFAFSSLSRQPSPPAAVKTTRANAKNGEMATGFQKVLKMARNSLKNPSSSGAFRSAIASNTLSGRRQVSPESDDDMDTDTTPKRTTIASTIPSEGRQNGKGDGKDFSTTSKEAIFSPVSPSRTKRTASPTEAAEAKVPRQAGSSSPKKTAARGPSKALPQIPMRSESKAVSYGPFDAKLSSHSSGKAGSIKDQGKSSAPFPGTPLDPTRDKRRPRAPSITSLHSFASRTHKHSTARGPAQGSTETDSSGAFPRAHLVYNLYKFMRHSSAAYGQNFMRILGIGSLDYFFPDTSKHHANVWAFAHHVGIPVDSILLNSFLEPQPLSSKRMSPLVNYVAVDDQAQAVVLTCRGTLGLSDILTDLTCTYEDIEVPGGKRDEVYQVHSGMLASAKRLSSQRSTVMQTIHNALEAHPDYGLVITGHSLGGGVASLLAILLGCKAEYFQEQMLQQLGEQSASSEKFRHPKVFTPFVTGFEGGLPPGRPIHAYAYGVPAVSSPDLSRYCRGLVTSVVHGHDLVPTLSLGSLRDMKNVAQSLLSENETDMAKQIVTKVVGLYQTRKGAKPPLLAATQTASLLGDGMQRPSEPPAHERNLVLEPEELKQGRSRNRANDSGYQDPGLAEAGTGPSSYSQGGGPNPGRPDAGSRTFRPTDHGVGGEASARNANTHADASEDPDADLQDWLWSLIKTIRADMCEEKLYPPGEVYCIESFPVFVTPRMRPSAGDSTEPPSHPSPRLQSSEGSEEGRAEAHRVILRYCEDVEKRFSEPIFAKSMLRDHIPTNYELCMSLLFESVVPRAAGA